MKRLNGRLSGDDAGEIDRILSREDEILPSSGFAVSVMDAVRREAAAPPAGCCPDHRRCRRRRIGHKWRCLPRRTLQQRWAECSARSVAGCDRRAIDSQPGLTGGRSVHRNRRPTPQAVTVAGQPLLSNHGIPWPIPLQRVSATARPNAAPSATRRASRA